MIGRPPLVAVGRARLRVRRETEEDHLARDTGLRTRTASIMIIKFGTICICDHGRSRRGVTGPPARPETGPRRTVTAHQSAREGDKAYMTPATMTIPRPAEPDTSSGAVHALRREPTRAAVAIFTGRGESREPYEWLAARLALDGYTATVVPESGNIEGTVGEVHQPGLPFVLLGSDSGALSMLAMADSPVVRPDGLVLLGLPLLHVPVAGIPVVDPPRVLPDLPILLVHGRDDQISPLSLVRMTTRRELAVVPGGHAVLGGPGRRDQHRGVPAGGPGAGRGPGVLAALRSRSVNG